MHLTNLANISSAAPPREGHIVPQTMDERLIELLFNTGVLYGKNIQALKDELAGQESQKRI